MGRMRAPSNHNTKQVQEENADKKDTQFLCPKFIVQKAKTQHPPQPMLLHSLVPREAGVCALEATDLAGVAARPVGLAGQPLAIRRRNASGLSIDALIV